MPAVQRAAFSASAGAQEKQDVVVIGGGPGGYVHAIKAAQLGMKVTCVEGRGSLGGCCLNVGCIPSKNLLNTTHLYHQAAHEFESVGIKVNAPEIDVAKMQESKQNAVDGLTGGIEGLFKKNGVNYSVGWGKITGPNSVTVALNDGGEEVIEADKIVIATGSDPIELPFLPFDEDKVVSSTGALAFDAVPESLAVIGGGVIGLEMASVWSRLGAEVTVIEFMDSIGGAGLDKETAKTFMRILKRQGINFQVSTKVTGADASGEKVALEVENKKGKASTIEAEKVLVSVGRRRYADGLGLEDVGVATDERGMVLTDGMFKTNVDSIYAIGDIIDGPMLAHKAEEDGIMLAELFAGHEPHIDYDSCPGVIYTAPEVAWVGKSEEELKEAGIEYNVGNFPMAANSRAKACGYTDGFVKVLSDKTTDRILGAWVVCENGGDVVQELVMAYQFGAAAEDVAAAWHPHPGMGEAVMESAQQATNANPATQGKTIHF